MPGLKAFSEHAFALLRIVAGLAFAFHGTQKLFAWPGGRQAEFLSQIWFAGAIELVGGLMIAFGILATVAAFIASGEMAVAYFQSHAPRGWLPIQNGGELALLYAFLFLYIAARGPGKWSLTRL
jgi:putative oxidoreductase